MATYYWTGISSDWNSATNWSPVGVPATVDTANFATSVPAPSGTTVPAPYVVSGNAAVGSIGLYGHSVTLTGTTSAYLVTVGLDAMLTIATGATVSVPSGTPDIAAFSPAFANGTFYSGLSRGVTIHGSLNDTVAYVSASTIAVSGAGASWTTSASAGVTVGYLLPPPEFTNRPSGIDLRDHAQFSGNLMLEQQAAFSLDSTTNLNGRIELQGGLLLAASAADPAATGPVIIANAVTLDAITVRPGISFISAPITANAVRAETGTSLVLEGGLSGTGSLVLSGGTITIGPAGAHTLSFDGQDTTLILTTGTPTLIGGGGNAVVFGGAATITAMAGPGRFTFVGERGSATVYGGTGSAIETGGSAGGNVLVASVGASTLFGGGAGDLLVANGGGGDILVASSGNSTLTAAGSTGNNTLVGGAGNNVLVAGRGSDQIIAGSGASTIFGGSGGTNYVFAGSGPDLVVAGAANAYIQAGRGNLSAVAGTGIDYFGFVAGAGGGDDALVGFKSGGDKINLQGFGTGAVDAALQSAQRFGGATVLSLSDGTRISVYGAGPLTKADFV